MSGPFHPGTRSTPSSSSTPIPYARLRDEDPVHRTPIGTLLVSRYDDVHRVLRDTETSVRQFETNTEVPEHMRPLQVLSLIHI